MILGIIILIFFGIDSNPYFENYMIIEFLIFYGIPKDVLFGLFFGGVIQQSGILENI